MASTETTASLLGDLCERLERGFEDASEFTVIVDKADLRTAIAELRRRQETADPKPFYRQDDKMFLARKVRDEDMVCWEESAAASIRLMLPGGINWPMIVRSLIAEVRSLRAEIERRRNQFRRENGGI